MNFTRKLGAAAISALLVISAYGCAGAPQRRGGGTVGRGVTGGATGGPAAGTTRGTTEGTAGGTTGAGMMAGRTGAGRGGAAAPARPTQELGQQISAFVAGIDGVGGGRATTGGTTAAGTVGGGAGGAPAGGRSVGVSTLVIGNLAFIGIDPATMGGNPAPGSTGSMGGSALGRGAARVPAAGGGTAGRVGAGTAGAGMTTADLEGRVRTYVRGAFPQVSDVFVTTNPPLVSRIARVCGDIQNGVSATRHLSEMFTIARTMAPAATTTGVGGRR